MKASALGLLMLALFAGGVRAEGVKPTAATTRANAPLPDSAVQSTGARPARADAESPSIPSGIDELIRKQLATSGPTLLLFTVASLVPAAVLMVTAFVRIQIVLTLLRQALGSPQVPGNQVLMALALLLTVLVMRPVGERVYRRGIEPYANRTMSASDAWREGTGPIKVFMVRQIERTHHERYLWDLYAYVTPESANRPDPTEAEQFPLRVVAPAYLLSELTAALTLGFAIYLPFLVVDLVVSAVLAAMGLFMLPPSLVSTPLKLILFVLADGWMLVAGMLLKSF